MFSILFRKTCGDLNQIAYAKYKDSIIHKLIPPFPIANAKILNLYQKLGLNTKIPYSTFQTPVNFKKLLNAFETLPNKTEYMKKIQLFRDNAFFLTFDEMAALIALSVKCKVIYTGGSSNLSNDLHDHTYTYNKKVGFATIGPSNYFSRNLN